MKEYKLFNIAKWIVVNGLMVVFGYYGLVMGVTWARNGFVFIFWVTVIFSLLVMSDRVRDKAAETPCSVPYALDATFDVSVCIALACLGHFIMASAWVIQTLMCSVIDGRRKELQKAIHGDN